MHEGRAGFRDDTAVEAPDLERMPRMVQAVEVVAAHLSTLLGTLVAESVRKMDRRETSEQRSP